MQKSSTTSPAPSITINVGDKPTEILMSFGRLNELAELVGAMERLPEIDLNPSTSASALEICLAPRDERGRRTDAEWFIPPDLSVQDGCAILDFAKEHLADFFSGEWRSSSSTSRPARSE
ncbi:hypothetical protein [Methylobacterium indicum]|uniref:Uncharacterized protein n=1 Tax=Methylobacterium indicum TaxID=1775910 RepID=A0ABR5HJ35_9HYPH|nr:hypothetical protein [Methylobacterium indicum]KMO20361.1 hypothetical protein QR78_10990 [Methylobacterium indicum]KMO26678.1 hypothetical protein QR79_01140 [Methylobacterium indicum]